MNKKILKDVKKETFQKKQDVLEETRDAFSAAKIRKEGSPKVFSK